MKKNLAFLFFVSFAALGYIQPPSCIVSVTCSDGGKVECSGNECSSTTSNGGSVTCDGKTTKC